VNASDAQRFFTVLTMITLVGTYVLITCRFLHRFVGPNRVVTVLAPFANHIAAAIALTSMIGSLYFSEVVGYVPCALCWYQRVAMYPLGIALVIAAVRRDRSVRWYVVPAAGIGAVISLYHWSLERFPSLDAGVCSVQVPCEFIWFEKFGFVTLAFMALTGFLAIITLVTLPDQDQT